MTNILAFETSCDDTAVAVVNSAYQVLSNVVSSQATHASFGGVVPELASRMHLQNIVHLTRAALQQAELELAAVSALAVSVNPGLIGALLVGVSFAKSLAYGLGIPIIAVNHMIGHIYAIKLSYPDLIPPYLALVVSGGHSELVDFRTETDFDIVGRTRDDAAGEAFDKIAQLMGLGYPGGARIDKLAVEGDADFVTFPRGLNRKGNFDFSFSGFKTAVRNYLQDKDEKFLQEHRADIAASVQKAIVGSLVSKTINYARANNVKKIIVAGGVSANSLLRTRMTAKTAEIGAEVYFPELRFCMDNAAMIGAAAVRKYQNREFADLELNAFSTKGVRLI